MNDVQISSVRNEFRESAICAETGEHQIQEGKLEGLQSEVIATIARAVPMDPGKISRDSTFEQLGVDSLDVVNIIFELEHTFGIKIPDEFSLADLQDVEGVARAIKHLIDG